MFSLVMKRILAAAASLLILGIAGPAFAAPAAGPAIPNPYVSYATYQDAARVLAFCPLTLSRDSGYALDGVFVIGGHSADLSFVRLGQIEATVRIRTALKKEISKENLSGIYGIKWNKQPVNKTILNIAQLGPPILSRLLGNRELCVRCPRERHGKSCVPESSHQQPGGGYGILFHFSGEESGEGWKENSLQ